MKRLSLLLTVFALALTTLTALAQTNTSTASNNRASCTDVSFPIDGAQANGGAGTGSAATGTGTFSVDTTTNTFTWEISYDDSQFDNGAGSQTLGHFHGPAPAGVNAGVRLNIGTSNPVSGTNVLPASQIQEILDGLWYVNIHTSAFGGGEIRGQVVGCEVTSTALLSEFEPNPPGGDPATVPFELSNGAPNSAFDLWIISVESDGGTGQGTVDRATNVAGTFDPSGFVTVTIPDLENPSFTVILTDDFTGTVGTTDIDGDNDGTVDDLSAFGAILDAIGVPDSGGDEATVYGADLGGADFQFIGNEPILMFRDGTSGEWNAIDPAGDVYHITFGQQITTSYSADPTVSTFGSVNPSLLTPTAISLSGQSASTNVTIALAMTTLLLLSVGAIIVVRQR